jgi:hypothetical protein
MPQHREHAGYIVRTAQRQGTYSCLWRYEVAWDMLMLKLKGKIQYKRIKGCDIISVSKYHRAQ